MSRHLNGTSDRRPTLCDAVIFLVGGRRVVPSSSGRKYLLDFSRPPGAFVVFIKRSIGLQYRIDNSPRFFYVILAGEQGGVSCHGVAQHAFVCFHFVSTRMTAGYYFD